VTPKELTLTVGATGQITVTIEPDNAANKKVNWTTSDADIVTVVADGNVATVTAVKEGTATITATSDADSSKKDSCVVSVEPVATNPELFELRVNGMPVGAHDITITETELNMIETLAFHLTEEAARAELLVTTTLENGIVVHEILADVKNVQYFSVNMDAMKEKHGHFPAGVYHFTLKLTNNKGDVNETVITVTATAEEDILQGYTVKVGDVELDVDAAKFLNAVAEWDGSTLVFGDGEITFEGSPTSDEYGRTSGLYLSTVEPEKDRTAETYVSIVIDGAAHYIVFDATPKAGADGRTSKYLCAIAAPATGYNEAVELADIEGYVFDFFFGQDKATKDYLVKVGEDILDVDAAKFLNAVAKWDGSTLVFGDGEITFEGSPTSDEYGRTSGLYLSTVEPEKDRTAETYVSIVIDGAAHYIVFDATPKAGADGRTSKYLCAIAAPATGYNEAVELADIEGYVFDFFFGQDKATKDYLVKVGEDILDVDAAKFLNAVAKWDGSTLVFGDGEITFEGSPTSDEYGRTSGLYLSTVEPEKDRTAETYVSIVIDGAAHYIVFDATPKAGADGRTSKYLCAIAAPATGYNEAVELADIEGYVFDFFFGQDKATKDYLVKVGEDILDVDAAKFLNAVAKWDGSTLVFGDGEITFEGSPTSDEYGRTSGLYLSTVEPEKDRTAETYVSIVIDGAAHYIVFDATPKAGADGRTTKYLCAIPADAATGYNEAVELADIEGYVFDFFFGQDKATKDYLVKVGEDILDVDAAKFLNAVAKWDGSTLVFGDGEITFEGSPTSDEYGRTSGLYLSTVEPEKDRTAETYVSIVIDGAAHYIVFDATPKAGADGRTSKYLCAIAAPATGYNEAVELADIEGYVFDFFFGQDKATKDYLVKVGEDILDVDAAKFLNAVAKWDGSTLVFGDGEITFEGSPTSDEYGRTSGLYLSTVEPEKDRTAETYVSIVIDGAAHYIVFDATPKAGADGRTSKYLCAIAAPATGYNEAVELADIEGYVFDFFFGQDKATKDYLVKVGEDILDVDAAKFLNAVAKWDGSTLVFGDGEITFEGSPTSDEYGRTSGLYLSTVEPEKDRTAETYVSIVIDGAAHYIVFDATPKAGADGRTSKYLCAIAAPATGYNEAVELADIEGYVFDFFFGQDKATKDYLVKVGEDILDVDAAKFLNAVAKWDGSTLVFGDGEITFEGSPTSDEYGRTSGLYLSTVEPEKDRTAETYVSIVIDGAAHYIVFDATPKAGADGRTSKYLCAIAAPATGYNEAVELADIEGYVFDFFFGQDKATKDYLVKVGEDILDVDAAKFLNAVAKWDGSTLVFGDGEITFEGSPTSDEYGRTSGLYLSTVEPEKDRTAETYVSIVIDGAAHYIVFDATPKAGADGRTSKYLCAIAAPATGYNEAVELADIEGYVFDFFFGQDKATKDYLVKVGEDILDVDAAKFLNAVAKWDGSTLVFGDGEITFEGSPTSDEYGRTSGLYLSTVEPEKDRTAETYVSIVIDGAAHYIVFDATPKAGADGRTSKYLCAIAAPATGYNEAVELADIEGYVFDFFFGQDPSGDV
jgi:succinyl-CoA synthetase beta subunit/Zn-dependent metalloprotease